MQIATNKNLFQRIKPVRYLKFNKFPETCHQFSNKQVNLEFLQEKNEVMAAYMFSIYVNNNEWRKSNGFSVTDKQRR